VEYYVSIHPATFFQAKAICYSYGGTLALVKTYRTRLSLEKFFFPYPGKASAQSEIETFADFCLLNWNSGAKIIPDYLVSYL